MTMPRPSLPSSYAELFATLPDILEGEYTTYLTPFSTESANAPAALWDAVLAANNSVPKVFLVMVSDPPEVKVIHCPTKFALTLGHASPWDNNNFAFASDVGAGNQVALVRWPDTAFTRTVQVRVPITAEMANSWTAAQGADCLGPFDANAPNTEEVRTRFMMAIPPAYAEFVMQCQKFMLRQLTTDLVPLIEANNHMQACRPLLDWIRVASTYRPIVAPAVNPTLPATHGIVLELPLSDTLLQNRQWDWVSLDLPSLCERTGGVMAAYNASMLTLTNELTQRRQEEAARAAAAAAPKQPAHKFPKMVTTFVRLCEVPTQQQLPPLYTRLANAGKQEVLSSIQALAEDRAGQQGSSGLAPIITPTILQWILYGLFGSVNADDIVGGLLIFLMMLGY